MNFLSTKIAWNYLRFREKDKNISFMIKICFIGIFIGTFALMLTLIITNGFEKVIHEKMQGITSQVVIHAPGKRIDDENIKEVIQKEFPQYITAMSSSSVRQLILDHNDQQNILFVKGIEPEHEGKVSSIEQKIIKPRLHSTNSVGLSPSESENNLLSNLLEKNQIIIGHKLAHGHNLKIGDEVKLLVPKPQRKDQIALKKTKAIISGIFKVGLEEYDNNFAYSSLDFLKSVLNEKKGVDQISLKLNDEEKSFSKILSTSLGLIPNQETQIIKLLKKRLIGLTVNSWRDLYPALVSSLKLEKYVMFFILALISLVACMNMISLLFMQIQSKKRDIAIFKAMGMPHKKIKNIFLSIGLSITFLASTLGLISAAIAGHLLEKYPFIELPDVYYVSHLPARLDPEIFLVVFVCIMILGFLSTWIPAKRSRKINIVEVLRKE